MGIALDTATMATGQRNGIPLPGRRQGSPPRQSEERCASPEIRRMNVRRRPQNLSEKAQEAATGREDNQATATGQEKKSAATGDNEQAIAETPSSGIGKGLLKDMPRDRDSSQSQP